MSRVIAGALSIVFGLILLFGYNADDYQLENALHAPTTEEAVRMYHANDEIERARDFHQIAIAVSLVLGSLMVANGLWILRRGEPGDDD